MLLAIETATLASGVALATADKLVAEIIVQTKKTHSERLMPHIEQLLELGQVAKEDITAIAVSIGPGSFTGLRIGLATAKALAYVWNVPVIGVSTLAALAYACPAPNSLICPLLDAQKGNVYQAVYRWEKGMLQEVIPPRVIAHQEAINELASQPLPVIMLGEGAVLFQEAIVAAADPIELAPPHIILPRAGSVALLGHQLLRQGIRHDVMTLEPLYIRRSEAEVLWEQRHGKCL
ncbi:tRNA threonylcarbamoyladenosine biosynthesis protein TsaB [Anaerospora hongkongensis]|uniref:tRNA threonylcarbamoyladenosine biosynthesis protein TsaB n=1 Tax=Anaerospora hongkongensis TaxID=244830 RepID=A0A4R1QAJ6_9FIRM|nr:tRNA (adenosine(37)-N6)-threonylcarbamoyltransferase complex dimerization subunit type 1 TsaB [Anaerospora hongkongensis]TCL39182.1 tRNA threonylcarbamoyladenosine biosynthesis protein TsaB [Anaerospora hongkongensis]